MIELAILGALAEHDLHGYELRRQLGDLLGSRLALSFGSVYPALAKLERGGFLKAATNDTVVPPPAPMSGSLAGELAAYRINNAADAGGKGNRRGKRGKKVYSLTDRGWDRLSELLTGPADSEAEFAVRIAFCHHLNPAQRLQLFRQRRAEIGRRRTQRRQASQEATTASGSGSSTQANASSASQTVNPYLRSLIEHDTETASAHLAWLDRLIADEERATAEAPPESQGEHPL